jgi:lactoylglutathione lyase
MKKPFLLILFLALSIGTCAQRLYPTINHIGIYVTDLKASAAFYMKTFHLDSVKTPQPGQPAVWLKLGRNLQLHLIRGTKDVVVSKQNHIAFSVPSMYDFTVFLKEQKIYYEGEAGKPGTFMIRADGVKQIYLRDPDGYRVEVNDMVSN